MDNFRGRVINFIKKIPRGRVVSYEQVAAVAGSPRAARQVGAILKSLGAGIENVPWWRVINNRGIISIKGNWTATKELQKTLLAKEGIKISQEYSLNIEKYRFKNQIK